MLVVTYIISKHLLEAGTSRLRSRLVSTAAREPIVGTCFEISIWHIRASNVSIFDLIIRYKAFCSMYYSNKKRREIKKYKKGEWL